MQTSTISARIPEKAMQQLEELSKATKRSKSFLAAEAIENYLKEQAWQIKAIYEGIEEADNQNFASNKEVSEYHQKWGLSAD